jgi:hypothetical protein
MSAVGDTHAVAPPRQVTWPRLGGGAALGRGLVVLYLSVIVLLPLAALVLVTIGMGWWNLMLQERLRAQQAALEQQDRFIAAVAAGGHVVALAGTDRAPGARGELVQPAGGGPPLLVVHGLPELPPNRVYQVWVIAGGRPASAGLLRPGGATTPMVTLERDLTGVQTVALTVEPAGGSPGPTTPIVLAGEV